MKDTDLADQIHDWFKAARDHLSDWRKEVTQNYEFYAGRQYSEDEMSELEEQLRPAIAFNRIQPMISAVKGYYLNNRTEARFLPREQGDVQVSELLTGAMAWVDDECDAEDELAECFEDLLIAGLAPCEAYISYDEDLDGKIHSAERIDPLEFFYDPASTKRNLADSKYRMRGRWMDRKDAETRWPKLAEIDISSVEFGFPPDDVEQPHDAARAFLYENDQSADWYERTADQVFVLQTQWWEHTPVYRIGDPQTGRIVEMSDKKFNRIKEQLDMMGVKYVRQLKKTFYQAFTCGPVVLEKGENIDPEHFTLLAATGKRDATEGVWFGLVRGMKDPQRWANKFFGDIQDILVSNRQGGAYVEEDAFVNPRQAEEDWNQPNALIMLKSGALSQGKVQDRNPIPYPQGLDRLMEWAISSLPATTGVSMEMMGFADRDQPNVLEVQRKRSSMVILADLFDAMRKLQKDRGRVCLTLIQEYMADGRLIRITNNEGKEQFVPLALNPEDTKYDVIVDEAASSPNQKQETFAILSAILPLLAQLGIQIPPDVLEYMPLPASLVSKLKDAGQQQMSPEQMQQQQQMAQLAMRNLLADIAEKESKAELNRAKVGESQTDAELNLAQAANQLSNV